MGLGIISSFKKLMGGQRLDGRGVKILAPLTGDVIPLEDVPDVVFSEKLAGDGVAIKPSGKTIHAPLDGVVKFFESNHCFTVKAENGLEILVHFGIDTVELSGAGFKRLVESGEKVTAGTPLIELDLPYLEANAKSTITPVVISGSGDLRISKVYLFEGRATAGFTVIISVQLTEKNDADGS